MSVGAGGVTFVRRGTPALRWPFSEIQGLEVSAHELVLRTYENRPHHEPGDRQYRFELQSDLSPQLAEKIAGWLGKPNQNADPDPRAQSFASIPAKRQKPLGGRNGELRFGAGGINFIAADAGDARAWRWADIQTIANPDPYHFRVAGYLETYEFELKEPMSAQLFDRLWACVYGQGLNLPESAKEASHER